MVARVRLGLVWCFVINVQQTCIIMINTERRNQIKWRTYSKNRTGVLLSAFMSMVSVAFGGHRWRLQQSFGLIQSLYNCVIHNGFRAIWSAETTHISPISSCVQLLLNTSEFSNNNQKRHFALDCVRFSDGTKYLGLEGIV